MNKLKGSEVFNGVLMAISICTFFTVGFSQDDIREIKKEQIKAQEIQPKIVVECKLPDK